jgi:hypothetical protein
MKNLLAVIVVSLLIFTSCKNDDPIIEPIPETKNLEVTVGGPSQPNQVFIDLSTGNQTLVDKYSWNLAFSNGNEYKVHLNPAVGTLAARFETADIASITSADVVDLRSKFGMDIIFGTLVSGEPAEWLEETTAWVDSPDGGISSTAISEIQAFGDANYVYVINPGNDANGNPRNWYKIRVTYSTVGKYQLEYALLDDENVKTANIFSDGMHNFTFFSLSQGNVVDVEPAKDSWDIAFTTWTELQNFGAVIPYLFSDYVIHNREKVLVAEFVITDGSDLVQAYDNFSKTDALALSFSSQINTIASGWRSVASPTPGSVTAVKSDRFYVVQDGAGTIFKLAFTKMVNETGERGFPAIQFTELK